MIFGVLLCGQYLRAVAAPQCLSKLCLLTSRMCQLILAICMHIPAPSLAADTLTYSCFSNSATVGLLAMSLYVIIQLSCNI